jgi:diguanylate cyclase
MMGRVHVEYCHSLEDAGEFAHLAIAMMDKQQITPHPNNFAVWYNYFSGIFPELNKALDVLLVNNDRVTESYITHVYRTFCGIPSETIPLHIMAEKMAGELSILLASVQKAGTGAVRYGKTLEHASGQIGREQHVDGLRDLIGRLLLETRSMIDQSREVEKKLKQSGTRIRELTEELEAARREAMTDALTGLANRKVFDTILRQASMESVETGEPLSLLFIDVDHFKNFNDTHGHQVGDQVLKLLALMLNKNIRGQDTAARYGGEEFALILPQTALSGATQVATKICEQVAAKVVVQRSTGGKLGQITVSIGVATLTAGESVNQFVARADRALYLAKERGRNGVATECDLARGATDGLTRGPGF